MPRKPSPTADPMYLLRSQADKIRRLTGMTNITTTYRLNNTVQILGDVGAKTIQIELSVFTRKTQVAGFVDELRRGIANKEN